MKAKEYDDIQRELSQRLARVLERFAVRAGQTMSAHAIATALIGSGTGVALGYLSAQDVARWLRMTADELEQERSH